ncbi:MAG: PAS domain-containing protein [Pseudomonadota bacterium]
MAIGLAVSIASFLVVLFAAGCWRAVSSARSRLVQANARIGRLVAEVEELEAETHQIKEQLTLANQTVTEQLELATQLSEVYIWTFDLEDGQLANARATFINVWESLGYDAPTEPIAFGTSMSLVILPEDQQRVMMAVLASLDGSTPRFEAEYRIRHKDGSIHWNLGRGIVIRDAHGKPLRFLGTSVDITELKHAEEASRKHKERLELAVLGSRVCTWDFELDDGSIVSSRSTYTNVWEALGYDTAEDPDRFAGGLAFLIPTEEQERFVRDVQGFLDGRGREWAGEYRVRHKDGSDRWHLTRGVAARDASGRATRFTGTSVDITDRKSMEQQLRESEQRWRSLAETLPQFVWTATVDGEIDYFSAQASRYTGLELSAVSWADIVHSDDREHTAQAWIEALHERGTFQVEHRIRRWDGEYRWFTTRGVAVRDDARRTFNWFGTCTDITTAKQQEGDLRHAKERLELAMRSSNLTIWEYDMPDGVFQDSHETLTNVWQSLGYDPLEKSSETLASVIHPDDLARMRSEVHAYLEGEGGAFETEHRVRHQDGTYRWILARGVAVRDDAERPRRFVGASVDITQIKRIEAELQRAREVAEAASRAKDEFLANVSHEIRTPMNAILGMTELAIDSARSERQRQLLSTVKSAARNLLSIIDDLLDFSKIAAGKLTLDQSEFSLRATLSDTLRALTTRAHKKGLELISHVSPDVHDRLVGDAGRLRQVLMNLVGNAIKFTARGQVVVEVNNARTALPLESASSVLRFTVRDTGIGIARDKQAAIFLAFEQEDPSTTRKYGGTGLGLTISARLVQLMGGLISVVSEPGEGSTFEFAARFARSTRTAEHARGLLSPELPEGIRVLVVASDERERRVLVEWLTDWRLCPVAVADATSAIETLARAKLDDAPYSLVLLDESLPDMDGSALAERIHEEFAAGTRLILLSADDAGQIAADSSETGILASISKPLQQSELLEALIAAFNTPSDTPPRAFGMPRLGSVTAPWARFPLRILVAEDNELNVLVLSELLAGAGHHVHFATDGRSALESTGQHAFDLLLLDLHMPELDGFAVTQAVRERERTTGKHLPIVAFTARSSKRDRERCLAAGMDDFLSKPIERSELWAAIERVVRAFPPAADAGPRLIDPSALVRACGGEETIFQVLRSALQQSLPGQLKLARSALSDGDRQRLAGAAHLLCGTLGAFSTVAADLVRTVEDSTTHQPLSTCTMLVERLESVCADLVRETLNCTLSSLKSESEMWAVTPP